MKRFDYHKPQTLEEAFDLIDRNPGARLIAGGTDLMVRINKGEQRPAALISLRSIPGLSGVQVGEVTRIGAMTTIADLIADPRLRRDFPVLVRAAGLLGGPQIRNIATIGGNLCNCSPCADMAGPLLVHEARVRLQSPRGAREVPIAEFFQGPGQTCSSSDEILTHVLLPSPSKTARAVFFKKGRVRMDLAIASITALIEPDGRHCRRARLAAGSVAPVPLRLVKAEELIEGALVTDEVLAETGRQARREISPISDVRASEDFRRRIVGV